MQSGPEPTVPEEAPSEAELEQAEVEVEAEVIEGDAVTSEEAAAEVEAAVEAEPDYKDQWMRSVAELDNFRKRTSRDAAQAEQRGIAKLARELLPALDNLDRAIAAAEAHPESANPELIGGIQLVQQELIAAFSRAGIVRDTALGEPFNPHQHEAVAQQPAEGQAAGTVIEVYEHGYLIGDEVLRAAKVVVAA
ncbi:MAG: nucleotide exchange factor GrpE [Solirubrobacterales bacterium]|nr:nucleotide exchange factor GrpE [Solirubrobacterales bacterium]